MRGLQIIVLLVAVAALYYWWNGYKQDANASYSPSGFVSVQMPDGAPRDAVLVLAPPNCPSEQARLAESLIESLTSQGIPVTRGDSISFDIANPTVEQQAGIQRAVEVFQRGAPAVFINGMAMSNPTHEQTAAEYQRTR